MQYYVYVISDPRCGTAFYVGRGKRNRKAKGERYDDHVKETVKFMKGKRWPSINIRKLETIQSIILSGAKPEATIIFETDDLKEADAIEKFIIATIGRIDLYTGPLTNMTDGGTGGITHDRSIHRERLSQASRAMWDKLSPDQRRIRIADIGAGRKAEWASLSAEEKAAKMKHLLNENMIQLHLDQLRENGFYQTEPDRNKRRRAKCSATMLAKWANITNEERAAFQQTIRESSARIPPEKKAEINIRRAASISKAYNDDPDRFANCHSNETRRKRGEAIKLGWERRNASISQSERDALTVKRQAQGRKSGETRRRQRDIRNGTAFNLE